jgi:hypothetical protein
VSDRLGERISDNRRKNELLNLTKSRIISILNSMGVDDLVPKKEFKSELDFENHVLSVIQKVRNKLFQEMKNSIDENDE